MGGDGGGGGAGKQVFYKSKMTIILSLFTLDRNHIRPMPSE